MPGPARLVATFLLSLQQVLEGPATGCRVRAPGPLLLVGFGPVAGCARDFNQFAVELLEPAALLIALFVQEQVAAAGHTCASLGQLQKQTGQSLIGIETPSRRRRPARFHSRSSVGRPWRWALPT